MFCRRPEVLNSLKAENFEDLSNSGETLNKFFGNFRESMKNFSKGVVILKKLQDFYEWWILGTCGVMFKKFWVSFEL